MGWNKETKRSPLRPAIRKRYGGYRDLESNVSAENSVEVLENVESKNLNQLRVFW